MGIDPVLFPNLKYFKIKNVIVLNYMFIILKRPSHENTPDSNSFQICTRHCRDIRYETSKNFIAAVSLIKESHMKKKA
jgi:hypothetical protein